MTNYNNGKIYKIESVDAEEGDIYIGSTTKERLCQRMTAHRSCYNHWKRDPKQSKMKSFDLFDKYGIENCKIILLESVVANSKDELLSREAHYIRTLSCVNKVIPQQTKKEGDKKYYQLHKEKILEQAKAYRIANLDKIKKYKKEYITLNKEKISEKKKIEYQQRKIKKTDDHENPLSI